MAQSQVLLHLNKELLGREILDLNLHKVHADMNILGNLGKMSLKDFYSETNISVLSMLQIRLRSVQPIWTHKF